MKCFKNLLVLTIFIILSCGKNTNPVEEENINPTPTALGKGLPGVVGTSGIAMWDALTTTEKNRIKGWNALFLHQSVGQDLEEGAKSNGFPFEYYGKGDKINKGLMGGIFVDVGDIANGNPYEKIRVFKEQLLLSKASVNIAIFKFGYADISDENYLQVQTAYKDLVEELKSKIPDIRVLHVTPPLVFSVESYEGNSARMKVGAWMRSTFASKDVVFDLQALESNDGSCKVGNVWRICPENRNTASDPSEVNGIDTSDGQGHIGKKAGIRISKSLLLSIYNCGK